MCEDAYYWFCHRCKSHVYVNEWKLVEAAKECPWCGYPRRAAESESEECPYGLPWANCSPSKYRVCSTVGKFSVFNSRKIRALWCYTRGSD